jgi:hypothetical protein
MGLNDVFDHKAFAVYSANINYCFKAYKWQDKNKAKQHIDTLNVPYQLYGFSQGASTVGSLVRQGNLKNYPEYIITIGAYKTTNVDFSSTGIPFNNYFDYSGIGQTSPGTFILVPHYKIQQAVNTSKNIQN